MNIISKRPLSKLGYDFVAQKYLPEGKDEYYLRDQQHVQHRSYRQLSAQEIEILVRNNNSSDNWNHIMVAEQFSAQLVRNCHFFGKIRIGKLEPYYLEFHNLRLTVGLHNSTICSCDIGDNAVIENVAYLSHYIIGNEVILANIDEMTTTDYSKFGNGILKDGEEEGGRIWLELCNENGGRKVLPFAGMLAGDAWLWTTYRENAELMQKFVDFTARMQDTRRGYYGMVGDRTVIKSCKIIKDTLIGTDAYLKGANKIKNLTIQSTAEAKSQVGEGCELVNGIMGYGCKAFYGVKAVRFVMGDNSSLKYGARLINSYLGDNSTISCCEVLNSLIFPAHEQHHNNSFLCAALLLGQSNLAAGSTIGSNHNSRGADGEVIAGRGFWPGLCVSLKHNSRFACFTLIAKGNYPAEINLTIPFSLLVHEESLDRLRVMPGYWFLYNMYALERNSGKYADRDQRATRIQHIEYDYLAPDSIQEMFNALDVMELAVGKAALPHASHPDAQYRKQGRTLLEQSPEKVAQLQLTCDSIENSHRPTELLKVDKAYPVFRDLIRWYCTSTIIRFLQQCPDTGFQQLIDMAGTRKRETWLNVGGQLMTAGQVDGIKKDITNGTIPTWNMLHDRYQQYGTEYPVGKFRHAVASLMEIEAVPMESFTLDQLQHLLAQSVGTAEWISAQVISSREKDYKNPFRKMAYDNTQQMEAVLGKPENNSFLTQTRKKTAIYKNTLNEVLQNLKKASRS
jgi:carbonic anhydrase/acetyltransferase-like protein (isoleucine patch superfamily)